MNNVVGKLLIVLQLVFSLLFMCFAGAVYTFQQGWRDKALKAQETVTSLNQSIDDLKEQQTQELESLRAETVKLKDRAETSEALVTRLQTNFQTIQGELAQTQQQRVRRHREQQQQQHQHGVEDRQVGQRGQEQFEVHGATFLIGRAAARAARP